MRHGGAPPRSAKCGRQPSQPGRAPSKRIRTAAHTQAAEAALGTPWDAVRASDRPGSSPRSMLQLARRRLQTSGRRGTGRAACVLLLAAARCAANASAARPQDSAEVARETAPWNATASVGVCAVTAGAQPLAPGVCTADQTVADCCAGATDITPRARAHTHTHKHTTHTHALTLSLSLSLSLSLTHTHTHTTHRSMSPRTGSPRLP